MKKNIVKNYFYTDSVSEQNEGYSIKVWDLGVKFNLSKEKIDTLKEFVIKLLQRQVKFQEFWALQGVHFNLKKGDRLGILGLNGAGKSTLLKLIAGVYRPTTGGIWKTGVVAPLLELGAGFDENYTARENVFLYGAVLGYSKKFLEEKFDEIIAFSELEEFIDVPVKNFSSGMRSRLGFSICTAVEPDILILDEVLSVGDAKFQAKSMGRIQEMFDKGVTVLFVSHSIGQVRKICDKALLLDHGKQVAFGDTETVIAEYERILSK